MHWSVVSTAARSSPRPMLPPVRASASPSTTARSRPRSWAAPPETDTDSRCEAAHAARGNVMQEPENFEAVYRQLEEVVRRLDEGGLTLDESIALYEDGMTLAQRCQALLDHAELRVTQLQELFTGSPQPDDDDED